MPHHAAPGHKGTLALARRIDPRREYFAARRAVGEAQRARPRLPPTADCAVGFGTLRAWAGRARECAP
eukprot:scaffold87476_cov79-Phaeocystis_antarctica.AAC.3